ncbi:hypothetical protein M0804_006051 [Polistes exclamans]|nr:hypothetical protein M0804_006051 [Polistes exclamans]
MLIKRREEKRREMVGFSKEWGNDRISIFVGRPSEDLATSINSTHRNVEELYRDAERLGKSGVDCTLTYPDCIESPLKSFTEILFP